jgi:NAD(P)-dependent dehydrogenase (short-subunit alcohol dehydrogenase family)
LVKEHARSVLALARDERALREVEKECAQGPGAVELLPADLTSSTAIEVVKRAVAGRRVAALVNNAGLLIKRAVGQWTEEDLEHIFRTNVFAPLLLIQALAPHLKGVPPGHVLNIGSMGGFLGSVKFPGLAAYSASKAALANLAECLAEEWKDQGICCNCLDGHAARSLPRLPVAQ